MSNPAQLRTVQLLVLASGAAALSWQVVWQIKSALALGVSAQGAALTLAVTMAGLALGALAAGRFIKTLQRPLRVYGLLEIAIGIAGLCLLPAFGALEAFDAAHPGAATHALGIALILGVPALCMGATIPVFGLAARQSGTSLSVLYGLNTLGAAAGALLAAFLLIPLLGVGFTAIAVACVNIAAGLAACTLRAGNAAAEDKAGIIPPIPHAALVLCATGFATFALEVAWFRLLTAAFRSTTYAFAIMLAVVLTMLGLGARLAPRLRAQGKSLGLPLVAAGILVLVMTPVVERLDLLPLAHALHPLLLMVQWIILTVPTIGFSMLLLGTAMPWILDTASNPRDWGRLYALNSLFCVLGALAAGWLLLPAIGAARTAWLAGLLVAGAGLLLLPGRRRVETATFALAAMAVAVFFHSGIGTTRVQGWVVSSKEQVQPSKVLEAYDGPDVSVAAVEYVNKARMLFIDGFSAAGENAEGVHYMAWMGHLPMMQHKQPDSALVICFGTGQTSNAVRREGPKRLDIVDINPRVFKLAHNFASNEDVLSDPRVTPVVMDGRAWMRRTKSTYDVITLEPMPPTFAGVNALYSREFYKLARARLNDGGMIAQWVPFHLLAPRSSASIARTFIAEFPNAVMWSDPVSKTGILLGMKDDKAALAWPGFARNVKRDLAPKVVRDAVKLDREQLHKFATYGEEITDDNQLLAYGGAVYYWHMRGSLSLQNAALMDDAIKGTLHRSISGQP